MTEPRWVTRELVEYMHDCVLELAGGAAERLAEMVPPGHEAHVHLTLTDDHPWAQAFVIIEAFPA